MKIVPLDESSLEIGIGLFNDGRYFDAHEAWEGPWFRELNAREKGFIQGLIMTAGAFLHARKKECEGAVRLLEKGIPFLRNGIDVYPDLKLRDFINELERLASREDWCTSSVSGQKLPRIMREYACEPHAERVTG